jgi:hypothetical protein
MIWARPAASPEMHAIASVVDVTALAYCRATFPSYETVELDDNPEHDRRCDGCCRILIDRRRVEWGLNELREKWEEL